MRTFKRLENEETKESTLKEFGLNPAEHTDITLEELLKLLNGILDEKYTDFFSSLSKKIDVDFNCFINREEHFEIDEITECLQDNNALDVEIIYYESAIKYLAKNDNSLQESLEIAEELGFELGRLNSEVLASLLASKYLKDEYYEDIVPEIETFLEELEELNNLINELEELEEEIINLLN